MTGVNKQSNAKMERNFEVLVTETEHLPQASIPPPKKKTNFSRVFCHTVLLELNFCRHSPLGGINFLLSH